MKVNDLKNELSDEKQLTENGALGYKTSGKNLLDANFALSSMRRMSEDKIYNMFIKAYFDDKLLALKWLFYARDIRGGCGERRTFRVILKGLANDYPEIAKKLIKLVPEYGRWDDLWCLLDTDLKDDVFKFVEESLRSDCDGMYKNKSVTLLAKWMPSANTSSKKTRELAKQFCDYLKLDKWQYSHMLKELRDYIDIVETKMSRNKWDKINYSTVPSNANLLYKNAFLKHDEERRKEFLESVKNGESKINSSVLFAHDIVHKYTIQYLYSGLKTKKIDDTLEELWKALPKLSDINQETIVVRDDSGSMMCPVDSKSNLVALEIATALSIYFSQYLTGEFKDKYISFSHNPKFIDLSNCNSLKEKLNISYAHSEVSDTDIYKTFMLILNTAIKNGYSQEEMPKNILILSDMEFNSATGYSTNKTLFDKISKKFEINGLKMPRLIFWNLCSRTNTIPLKENDLGVALVSGFSQNILNMVLKGNLDPYLNLVEVLNTDRYNPVEEALQE